MLPNHSPPNLQDLVIMLRDYPEKIGLSRVSIVHGEGLGDYLPFMGKVQKFLKERTPDYYDKTVSNYLTIHHQDPTEYNKYKVCPNKQVIADRALLRYNRAGNPFSAKVRQLYQKAGTWLDREFGPHLCDSYVLNTDTVISHQSLDKSAGFPWNYAYPNKSSYWDSCGDFYAQYWDRLATPAYIRSLCGVSIKEEMRPIEKIDNNDGRTIISMDVNHVTAHMQLCLLQNERLIRSANKHSSALGMVQEYGGWDRLNARMSKWPGRNTLELDGKKYDGRFRYLCFEAIRDFRFRMLRREDRTPENKLRLRNLYYELAHSPLVNTDGTVLGRESGNPSGQACTTPDNTLKNFMDMVVLWHLIMPEEYHSYEAFHYYVVMCICGDDINVSVHPEIQHLFNAKSILAMAKEIDMEYHIDVEHFRFNHECSFLGHTFKMVDVPELGHGMYLPDIDCEKMRTSMLIYNEDQTVATTIVRACGIRKETFPCEDCRNWFGDLIAWLRNYTAREEYRDDPAIVTAWKSYLTDSELWGIYTGLESTHVHVRPVKFAESAFAFEHIIRKYGTEGALEREDKFIPYMFETLNQQSTTLSLYSQSSKTICSCSPVTMVKGPGLASNPAIAAKLNKIEQQLNADKRQRRPRRPRQPAGAPIVVVKQGNPKKRRNRKRNRKGGNRPMGSSYMATDGLNKSRVVTNKSTIEDRFAIRREKIGNVSGTSAFTIAQSLYINPGNSVLFPIFSQIAATYEEYRCNFCQFSFETDAYTATNGTASAGKVILATNYDPDDVAFTSDTQMENYVGSVKGPPYAPVIMHDVMQGHKVRNSRRGDFALNNYFVNPSGNSAAPSNSTSKFYDLGLFQMATSGNAVTTEIGELYVTYSFTMIRPKQQTPLGQNLLQAHIVEYPAASGATTTAYLGTTGGVLRLGSTLQSVATKTTFTLPVAGTFVVACGFDGSSSSGITLTPGSNIVGNYVLVDSSTYTVSSVNGGTATGYWVFNVNAAGTGAANTITISGVSGFAAGTADIMITQISSGLTYHPLRRSREETDLEGMFEAFLKKRFNDAPLVLYGEEKETVPVPAAPVSNSRRMFGY